MVTHDKATIGIFSHGLFGFACQCGFVRDAATEADAEAIARAHARDVNVPIDVHKSWLQAVRNMQAAYSQVDIDVAEPGNDAP